MDQRARILAEAERIALADHPMIPPYFYAVRRLVRSNIEGWIDNARGIYHTRWLLRID